MPEEERYDLPTGFTIVGHVGTSQKFLALIPGFKVDGE